MHYDEDTLVQQTTAAYLAECLGWESVYAYNSENFGPEGLLGRESDQEVVLTRQLRAKLMEFNPGLPSEAYEDAVRQLVAANASQSLLATNREKYELIRDGVQVAFRNTTNERVRERLRVIDFDNPDNNHFLCVRELWVRGDLYRRRADIVGFVNGLPFLFMELKNLTRRIEAAYEENYRDYLDTIPHLFHHNAMVVLANGTDARVGALKSPFKYFREWKRLSEDEPGAVDMETLLKGVCDKKNFIDLLENFILFDDSTGETRKIFAQNQQFLGVNQAVEAVRNRHDLMGKLGVFWHTQGSGKSYSIVMFARKVHRKLGGNYTFIVLTDREDLDSQIYKTFAGCGVADNDRDPCRASSGEYLRQLLAQHKSQVFTLIQKFNQEVKPGEVYSDRADIIVISDEAHRTQYGNLALNMRNALPKASYIGFTGTPLFKDDEITSRMFGCYISTYDFQRAVEDGATVPLYYDARGEKLGVAIGDLNERLAEKVEDAEIRDLDVQQRLEKELKRDYHIITAEKRLDQIARDFVQHYSTSWETGKAMLVCIDKVTCVRMYNLITRHWSERIGQLEAELASAVDEQDEILRRRQIAWMRQTLAAVVVSEEQGEVARFRQWDLDITSHRRLLKEGFELTEEMRKQTGGKKQRLPVDDAFKEKEHPFRIAIVCAMWLTGFDVPCLSTLYLDKPLKSHTLMQAIARANRVDDGKENGLIVDYCGIIKQLRKALATFAGVGDQSRHEAEAQLDPTHPDTDLLAELDESISLVRDYLQERQFTLSDITAKTGFERNAAILTAKEAVNENDETRKRFEVMSRTVFRKFKACLTVEGINRYRADYNAVNILYKSLQQDRERADISDIIRQLHQVIDDAIEPNARISEANNVVYDISRIDFERLRQEFAKSRAKHTLVQELKSVIDKRVQRLLLLNPLRVDFQLHYEHIVSEYNRDKDRLVIESTFAALLQFYGEIDEEEKRHIREGLDEEELAIFDLLRKPELSPKEIEQIKNVATQLLETLKAEKLRIDRWRDKEATRDDVKQTIYNFLWSDKSGLPSEYYSDMDVVARTDDVYRHIFRAYPFLPSPIYASPMSHAR